MRRKAFCVLLSFLITIAAIKRTYAVSLFDFRESSNPLPLEPRETIGFSYLGLSSFSERTDYKTFRLKRVMGIMGVSMGIISSEPEMQHVRKINYSVDIRFKTTSNNLRTEYLNRYSSESNLILYSAHISPRIIALYAADSALGASQDLEFTESMFLLSHSYHLFASQRFYLELSEKIKRLPVVFVPTFGLKFSRRKSSIEPLLETPSSIVFSLRSHLEHKVGVLSISPGLELAARYFFDGKTNHSLSTSVKVGPAEHIVLSGGISLSFGPKGFGMEYPAPVFMYFGAHIVGGVRKGAGLIRIFGRVVDENYEPVEGALIQEEDGYGAISGRDGRFILQIPEEKEGLKVLVSKEGFRTLRTTLPRGNIVIRLERKSKSVSRVTGRMLDEEENAVTGQVLIYEIQKIVRTDENGEFNFELTPGRYSLIFLAEDFHSKRLDIVVGENDVVHLLINLTRIKGGISVVRLTEEQVYFNLPNLKFDRVTGRIFKDSYGVLDALSEYLKKHTDLKVLIEVFVDRSFNPEADKVVTEVAAEEIKHYLLAKGVHKDRFIIEGKGSEIQIASNDTPENREKNRRVVIRKISDGETHVPKAEPGNREDRPNGSGKIEQQEEMTDDANGKESYQDIREMEHDIKKQMEEKEL